MRVRIQLLFKVTNLQPLVYASIVSVHGPSWLYFETLKLLNFDFHTDPGRIRIQLFFKVMNLQPLLYAFILSVHGPPRLYFETLKAFEF
jgi:hypothetical protein